MTLYFFTLDEIGRKPRLRCSQNFLGFGVRRPYVEKDCFKYTDLVPAMTFLSHLI